MELSDLVKTMAEEPNQPRQPGAISVPSFTIPQHQGLPVLPEERSLYFNGFAIGVTGGDIVLTLVRNVTLNASFTVAKTFGEGIVAAIQQLEKITNHQIMTVQEVAAAQEVTGAAQKPNPSRENN